MAADPAAGAEVSREDPYAPLDTFCDVPGRRMSLLGIAAAYATVFATWMILCQILLAFTVGYDWFSATGMLLLLASFAFMLLPAFAITRRWQHREPITLFGDPALAAADALRCVRALLIFLVVINLLPPWDFSGITFAQPPVTWALLLILGLPLILLQITAEEVVYRGFLLQSLRAHFRSPLAWMVVPSIVFGLTHYWNGPTQSAAHAYVIYTFFFGIAAADLTARSGTLGPAIALHFTTNILSILFFTSAGLESGLALFALPEDYSRVEVSAVTLLFDVFFIWMLWMVCRIAIRR